jgi:hypothetical protein
MTASIELSFDLGKHVFVRQGRLGPQLLSGADVNANRDGSESALKTGENNLAAIG